MKRKGDMQLLSHAPRPCKRPRPREVGLSDLPIRCIWRILSYFSWDHRYLNDTVTGRAWTGILGLPRLCKRFHEAIATAEPGSIPLGYPIPYRTRSTGTRKDDKDWWSRYTEYRGNDTGRMTGSSYELDGVVRWKQMENLVVLHLTVVVGVKEACPEIIGQALRHLQSLSVMCRMHKFVVGESHPSDGQILFPCLTALRLGGDNMWITGINDTMPILRSLELCPSDAIHKRTFVIDGDLETLILRSSWACRMVQLRDVKIHSVVSLYYKPWTPERWYGHWRTTQTAIGPGMLVDRIVYGPETE